VTVALTVLVVASINHAHLSGRVFNGATAVPAAAPRSRRRLRGVILDSKSAFVWELLPLVLRFVSGAQGQL